MVRYISQHFENEIRRGTINSGLKTIDEVQQFLRQVDETPGPELNRRLPQGRGQNENNRWRCGGHREDSAVGGEPTLMRSAITPNQNQNLAVIMFNRDPEELLLDTESGDNERENRVLPVIKIIIGCRHSTPALVDSGSQLSCISEDFLEIAAEDTEIVVLPVVGVTLKGAFTKKSIKITKQVLLSTKIGDMVYDTVYVVVPGLNRPVILGFDWLVEVGASIECKNEILKIPNNQKGVQSLKFKSAMSESTAIIVNEIFEGIYSEEPKEKEITRNKPSRDETIVAGAQLFSEQQKQKFQDLLRRYSMIWSEKLGLMKGYEHEIKLRDYSPFYLKSYPIPNAYKAEVEKQLQEMVDWRVLSPGTTEFVSPLVMVKKKDNSVKVCLDARFLNSRMVQEHITPPNPEQILMNFSDHKCMSLIDLTSSYWQIQIKESDRKHTGFSYNNQTYVFNRLPFGLSTSVASFIRGLNQVLGSDILQFVTAYVDDMLIISEDSDMHLIHLERLFCRLQEAGITVKLKKSKFACSEIEFLGHIIKPNGVSMNPKRIEAIKDFSTPRNPRHLEAFLGLCGYGRRFCANLGNLTEPLVPLLRKGHSWSWGPQQLKAFEDVKEAFLKVTMLCHPNPDWPYIIQTDNVVVIMVLELVFFTDRPLCRQEVARSELLRPYRPRW
ncbi:hypothetical protein ILUMI_03515 [Ignelater luminosus]|uniref:RNA-directed DNA polymerase n=1 Tax=Ignelater luminosus TaxID=2038154 RepID=A0A8K0GJV4_IGNLU|nr:hypothetical protein ILUMI_03515 [Ignelater luminosus]